MQSFPEKARTAFCVLAENQREDGSLGGDNTYNLKIAIRDVYTAMSWVCSSIVVLISIYMRAMIAYFAVVIQRCIAQNEIWAGDSCRDCFQRFVQTMSREVTGAQ